MAESQHEMMQRLRDEQIAAVQAQRESEIASLEGMSKAELAELAERRGVVVVRGDGEEGEPLKADYLAALS